MIGQGLEIKQVQKLTPIQIQTIKLIEAPLQELEQKVRAVLSDNPVVDESTFDDMDNDVSISEMESKEKSEETVDDASEQDDDEIPAYNLIVNNKGKDEDPQYNTFSVQTSFSQSLYDQLGFCQIDEHEATVAKFIIGSLDNRGYLVRDLESLIDDMAFRQGLTTDLEEVEKMLAVIQSFEPAGVGARNLRECLLLQIARRSRKPEVENAETILKNHFDDFQKRNFQKIIAKMHISEQEWNKARNVIVSLSPYPGGDSDSYQDRVQQVIPDFNVEEKDGKLVLTMPRFKIPELKFNPYYESLVEDKKGSSSSRDKEAVSYVKQKMDSAKWFIEALKQRQTTLYSTMSAIVEYQLPFFETGDEISLKPMVLKDIAEKTGYDISTISRVVNSKWVETNFGVFPLKHFFSEGLENSDGEEISTREIKKVLKDFVASEDKRNPLTDDELVDLLTKKGYKVARRTIAKYRSQLDIPKARMRREL